MLPMVYTEVVGWRPMGYCPKLEKAVTGEEGSLTKSLEDPAGGQSTKGVSKVVVRCFL